MRTRTVEDQLNEWPESSALRRKAVILGITSSYCLDRRRGAGSAESRLAVIGMKSGPTTSAQPWAFAVLFGSGLEALCVTGYAANAAAAAGELNVGMMVCAKPFNTTPHLK